MKNLSLEQIFDLLGTKDVPGNKKELGMLRIRLRELMDMNGEDWIRQNRKKLLAEWEFVVRQKMIT